MRFEIMGDENTKKSKLSRSKTLIKTWFSTKSESPGLRAKDHVGQEKKCRRKSNYARRSDFDLEASQATEVHSYRIFTVTWNVAGKSPPTDFNIEDWLHASPSADIYVLGFQEVVPLNAGNVLGTEDNVPARKWLALIQKTLNDLPTSTNNIHTSAISNTVTELVSASETSITQKASSLFHRHSFQSFSLSMRITENISMSQPRLERRFSVCDRVNFGQWKSNYGPNFIGFEDENGDYQRSADQNLKIYYNRSFQGRSKYCLVGSKQMVGIFLTVWVKQDLREHVHDLKVSCVERGLMGYLGNKGSISISMSLHQTSFCFVCSHLTSGQKEGDELRRNLDVIEILKKTRFSRNQGKRDNNSPRTILEHDRIVWLGDLNYRIALPPRSANSLVKVHNWRTLLDYDQLRVEQNHGRVFKGWHEGEIHFLPTYKYLNNSDTYAGDDMIQKNKRRTPAWCDRILWYGKGLHQLCYVRGESKFSDHRPVYSVFLAEVESLNYDPAKNSMSSTSSRIEVEELWPCSPVDRI